MVTPTSVSEAPQSRPTPALACNLKAISAAERPRYNVLIHRVRSAIRDRRELPDGYSMRLDSKEVSVAEAGEWIAMERLCCPFLTLTLSVSGSESYWTLQLTGPDGIKPLLRAEFPDQ